MDDGKQPERLPLEGAVSVTREGLDRENIRITVQHGLDRQTMLMGGYNAWRVFGMLGMMLGIGLPVKILKRIKM